ncbi:MAG: magnesium/cobalt transporter CorA [Gammaproteobacteria bacterium]|nr:magnesium/cobalt transporter CorA [Gammaproteobacteria bacterium]
MIRTMLYQPATRAITTGNEDLLSSWQQQPDAIVWADFSDNAPEIEQHVLVETFGLHPLAIQDAQRSRHQPKIEVFPDNVFILLKGLGADTPGFEFETIQIAMFVGDNFLVTRHSGPSTSIDRLWQALQQDHSLFAGGPAALALRLSRISVDRYLNRLLTLEPRLEDLEQEIVASPRDEILEELMGFKTNLRKFRRVLLYHVQVFLELLNNTPPQVRTELAHEIRDVFEHQERANSLATLYYEVASDLIDGYISLASHRLNNIMKVLTIVMAIFVPLSFLAGIYGMNFEYMPELKSRSGYYMLLGVMSAIAATMLLLFRRKRWL